MRVVILGAGRVGSFLARELRDAGHAVIMIEQIKDRALDAAEESGALVLQGDGTDLDLLSEIDLNESDYLVALTNADEDNLVACQLARAAFGVRRMLARLNDPTNRRTFDALDIPVVSVTDLLAKIIVHELDVDELVRVALIGRGEVSIFEIELPPSAGFRTVSDLDLPPETVLVAIHQHDAVIIPNGASTIGPSDRVLVATKVDFEDDVRDALFSDQRTEPDR